MLHVMFGYRARKHLSSTSQPFEVFAPQQLDLDGARKFIARGKREDIILLTEARGIESVISAVLESRSKNRMAVFGYFGSGSGKYVDLVPATDYETEITKGVE